MGHNNQNQNHNHNHKHRVMFLITKPTITILSLLLIILLTTISILTFSHSPLYNHNHQNQQEPEIIHSQFLSLSDNSSTSSLLRALTRRPHLAGTPSSLAVAGIVSSQLSSLNLPPKSLHFRALLSFPIRASLSLLRPNSNNSASSAIPLSLSEWVPLSDNLVPPFHAYSVSGKLTGLALFVNHGRPSDYRALDPRGCVVLVRRGAGMSRAAVVKEAEKRGASAVLTFTGPEFPDGFERGTVARGAPGDPLTPGWGSSSSSGGEEEERLPVGHPEVSRRFPKIPSMPVSWNVAVSVLSTLGRNPLPHKWQESLGSLSSSLVRGVGPGPTILDFDYQGENREETIRDVFTVIEGSEEPDRYVIMGNHRDAWTYGAVDPNSGTAALLDVARRFSLLRRTGWRPRRSIILSSWDAEEFGMIGSTEWVERNLLGLGAKAVAYLNVDCAVQGPGFFAGATPQLDNLILDVLKKVNDPELEGATMHQKWTRNENNTFERLNRVDSDFAAFVQHAGIPSVDMYYGREFPGYHTAFDSYDWMKNHGDPLFHRHGAIAGIWGLLALRLANDPIIPFDYRPYADQLKSYEESLSKVLGELVPLSHLTASIQEFASAAIDTEIESRKLADQEAKSEADILKRRALNDRLMLAEKGFLDSDGLEGRRWFKHLIYGPPNDPESKIEFFPGIADAISKSAKLNDKEKKAVIGHEIWRVIRAVQRATSALRGELNIGQLI